MKGIIFPKVIRMVAVYKAIGDILSLALKDDYGSSVYCFKHFCTGRVKTISNLARLVVVRVENRYCLLGILLLFAIVYGCISVIFGNLIGTDIIDGNSFMKGSFFRSAGV